MVFAGASIEGDIGELRADIWDASLELDGTVLENEIPISFNHVGAVTLRMHLDNSSEVIVSGSRATLTLLGEAFYVEEFPRSSAASAAA